MLAEFGANLRRERSGRGITQERLAELADLNPRTVQKIEAGRLNVLVTTAARLRDALDCDWRKLMPGRAGRDQGVGASGSSGRP